MVIAKSPSHCRHVQNWACLPVINHNQTISEVEECYLRFDNPLEWFNHLFSTQGTYTLGKAGLGLAGLGKVRRGKAMQGKELNHIHQLKGGLQDDTKS